MKPRAFRLSGGRGPAERGLGLRIGRIGRRFGSCRGLCLAVLAAWATLAALPAAPALAQPGAPSPLQRIGFDQRVGASLPGQLTFRDETGRPVRLGDYLGRRPVLLELVYYRCPMLCTMTLSGLTTSLKAITLEPARDFEVVVVSIDPRETPAMAAQSKREALARYRAKGPALPREPQDVGPLAGAASAPGWHFLTGDQNAITRLARAVGFRYFWDQETRQFAHPAGLVVVTPEGRLARYFYGIDFQPKTLRLSLVEAAGNRIGTVVDQVMLYCFHYDPVQGRYNAATLNIVRLGAILTVAGLAAMVVMLRRREPGNA